MKRKKKKTASEEVWEWKSGEMEKRDVETKGEEKEFLKSY